MGNRVPSGYLTGLNMTMELNLANLTKGIRDWQNFERAVDRGYKKGQEELAKRLKDKMIEYLGIYGLGDSEIINSIKIKNTGEGISVMVGSDYAIYVEYGTGVVGASDPHPKPFTSWKYDINNHGEKGWFYPTTENDPNPNKHVYNGILYGWTKGMPSRPFVYRTWLWGRRSATQIIRKNIRNEIKKVKGVKG